MSIKYSRLGCYKYRLEEDYSFYLARYFKPDKPIKESYFELNTFGWLTIRKGYAWDGPSGPTIDTPDFMRASLLHDTCYQMFRLGLFDCNDRIKADTLLYDICLESGMAKWRATYVYLAVRWFAGKCAKPGNRPVILTAP